MGAQVYAICSPAMRRSGNSAVALSENVVWYSLCAPRPRWLINVTLRENLVEELNPSAETVLLSDSPAAFKVMSSAPVHVYIDK